MNIQQIEKGQIFILAKTIEYTLNFIYKRAILRKAIKDPIVKPSDSGDYTRGRTLLSPFDISIQMLEGHADVTFNSKSVSLKIGQKTIIPSLTDNIIVTRSGAKVLTTVIQNGYEDEWFI